MSQDKKLPAGRLSRLSRLAWMGARSGAGMLLGREGAGALQAAEALSSLRGLAAKVGQMASYVDGVVPESQQEAYGNALKVLQAQAARSSASEVRQVVETELKAPIDRLFSEWNDTPIASASIGQVHRARLHTGEDVAVKVQHPGIDRALNADLANAGLIETIVSATMGDRVDAKAMFAVVKQRFQEELNYRLEAERLTLFANNHQGDPTIVVPQLFVAHSSQRVLTTSFCHGEDFDTACTRDEASRHAWAQTMWRFVFKSILGHGLLMADPHPGNYIFQPNARVVFLDYGCVQTMDPERRRRARVVHEAAIAKDHNAFDRAAVTLVEARPGMLMQPAIDYVRGCFQPLLRSPYRITRPYAAELLTSMKTMAHLSLKAPRDEFFGMPPDMLFVNRLQFGFYSVLARLNVEVDYASVEREFLKGL